MTRIRSVPALVGLSAAPMLALSLLAAPTCAAAAEPRSGAEVYELVCTTCHEAGVAGAPKRGDVKAWKPLIAEGQASLSRTAIKGIRGMPAKGGRPDLSDLEVRRAVAYLANASGAKWAEPKK
ncbi:MAG: cytochrome c5 family protein [Burkholderiales bacterium]|nr:MAG: cytochrome c5 family protein [Burkholderiales bacterium]